MKLLIVLPFCKADAKRAQSLLEWIGELGGCPENDLLIVSQSLTIEVSAPLPAFKSYKVIAPPFALKDESHPIGPNWMFETTIKHLSRTNATTPFLWLEPDCVPMRKGWLQEIEAEYDEALKRKHSILTNIVTLGDPKYPAAIPNGIAVYPPYAWKIYSGLQTNRKIAWDVQFADRTFQLTHPSTRILSRMNHKLAPTFVHKRTPQSPKNTMTLADIPPSVALFHPSKDGTLIDLLRGKVRGNRSVFYHSGDLGDVIYSLITTRELGGGEFLLGPDNRTNMSVREKMTAERAAVLMPLLEAQPYIHRAEFSEEMPAQVTHDLNKMRLLMREQRLDLKKGYNIARVYLEAFGLDVKNDERPWLQVQPKPVAEVIVNRSSRYHNRFFKWSRIVKEYRGKMAFVGLPSEHKAFCDKYGPIPRHPTKDLLEAAEVIAGAKLFVGNQSCCYAIAEGLKQQAILETCPEVSNTIFHRANVIHGCTEKTILPFIGQKRTLKYTAKSSLIISGPVDYFTGIGRETCQLAAAASKRKLPVSLDPITLDKKRLALPPEVSKLLTKPVPKEGFRLLVCPFKWIPDNLRFGDTLLTMWESTRLDPEIVAVINQRAERVIVPSSWCATVFSANGVTTPIHIVPLSVDTEVFKPMSMEKSGAVTFGAAGRLAHGGKRKGIEDVIEAFGLAFPKGDEKAKLKLKLFDDCYIPETKDPRIEVIAGVMSDGGMAGFYNSLDCFVCASKAEGWGLHAHEALACGTPVLAPRYSGLADIEGCEWISFEMVEASEGYSGHWCQPSVGGLSLHMNATPQKKTDRTAFWTPEQNLIRILEVMAL